MTRIFDNIRANLGPHLQETLAESYRMDVAVGYFNLRGWQVFNDGVASLAKDHEKPVVRLLVGMLLNANQIETLNQLQGELDGSDQIEDLVDNQTAKQRRDQLLADFRMQLSSGLPNQRDRETLQSLRDQVKNEQVQIKVFTRRPLHGKTYIFYRDTQNVPIVGFVGSSNLTASGLQSNFELNVDVVDSAASQDLAIWFNERWEDVFSISINAELLDLIAQSWIEPAKPYEVYLKLCYEISRDIREGRDDYSITGPINEKLLDYQREAVRTLAKRVISRGGTMLGDVVGLGKTLSATAVSIVMRDEYSFSTLVVCPKNLVSMWQEHLHHYQIPGKVIPYSMVARNLPKTEKYRFVIVDESHTMRNRDRKDYIELQRYIREWDSKVLLLTATPYNIGFSDVASQLGLWIDDDTDLGLQPSVALAKDPSIADKVGGKVSTLAAFLKSEEPEDWQRLMSEHMVRRTRSFIKSLAISAGNVDENGPYLTFSDGSKFHFPKRKPIPITHEFAKDDPARLMVSDETLDVINSLHLPRYDLATYVDKGAKLSPEEVDLVADWKRSRGQVKGFVRTSFYKRLSSCGYSFDLSLRRHIARNNLFIYALNSKLEVPTGSIVDRMFAPLDDDNDYDDEISTVSSLENQYEALKQGNNPSINWVRAEVFSNEFVQRILEDTSSLQKLLDNYGDWSFKSDSKLKALSALLAGRHRNDKVLIFTEYKDTAVYLGESLKKLGIKQVEVASGDSANPTQLAHRFSPLSNKLSDESLQIDLENPINVLVATDVLSEGQNLQDSHVVLNYDLPWAIIKLIQRAGRVDRVGQRSSEVLIYSMFHGDVENVLNLRNRIKKRLENNAKVFGSDEQFFGTADEVKLINEAFKGDELSDPEDEIGVDAASLAFEAWSEAIQADPTLEIRIPSLPDLVHSTKGGPAPEGFLPGISTFVRTERGFGAYGYASGADEVRLITAQEALKFFKCEKDEVALPDLSNFDFLMERLVKGSSAPLNAAGVTHSALKGVRKRVWSLLTQTLNETKEVNEALELLNQYPLTFEAERVLRRAVRNGNIDELSKVLVRLNQDNRLVVISEDKDSIRIVCTMGIT